MTIQNNKELRQKIWKLKEDMKRNEQIFIDTDNERKERFHKAIEIEKQKEQLKKMIDTAIGLAYDRDNDEAMDYLINEKDHYPELRD